MTKSHQTGKRFQVLVIQNFRDKTGAVRELIELEDYFKKKGVNYKFLHSAYGSPSNSLVKTVEFYLNNEHIAHPYKTFKEIMDLFLKHTKLKSIDVADIAVLDDLEKMGKGFVVIVQKLLNIKRSGVDGDKAAIIHEQTDKHS